MDMSPIWDSKTHSYDPHGIAFPEYHLTSHEARQLDRLFDYYREVQGAGSTTLDTVTLTRYYGSSYNKATGRFEVTKETKEHFVDQSGTSGRSRDLLTIPELVRRMAPDWFKPGTDPPGIRGANKSVDATARSSIVESTSTAPTHHL